MLPINPFIMASGEDEAPGDLPGGVKALGGDVTPSGRDEREDDAFLDDVLGSRDNGGRDTGSVDPDA